MKITSLIENTSCRDDIIPQHGLSLFIETNGKKILFDTGQSDLFAKNAAALGIGLADADIAVISHGHYDHGGGLETFLSVNGSAPVYINRHAFEPHFNADDRYIGLDVLLETNERIVFTDGDVAVGDGVTLFSGEGREKKYDLGSFGLKMRDRGELVPDDFRHEQYLMIEEKGRRVLFSGCSHMGIMDIEEWFSPDVLVGGFHFSKLPTDGTLADYAMRLASFDTDYYTCHCTGTAQYEFMKKYMNRLTYLPSGKTVEI